MTPDMSRACARVQHILNLPPGPEMDALLASAATAERADDLPPWARAVLAHGERQDAL